MDTIALISGGKDSFLALLHAIKQGHRIVALANLHPPLPAAADETTTVHLPTGAAVLDAGVFGGVEELDSFMYQTVGSHLLPLYASALGLPLYRRAIVGSSVLQTLEYGSGPQSRDETEDLMLLLRDVMRHHPTATAVSAGAILSTYQRTRIESVCARLGLVSLAYLWQRNQTAILEEMITAGLDARIVKVAALGLDDSWLWQNVSTQQSLQKLKRLEAKWGVNVAGEGGEFETIVVKGPGWNGRIIVSEDERVQYADGGAYWVGIKGGRVVLQQDEGEQSEWIRGLASPDIWEPDSMDTLGSLAVIKHTSVNQVEIAEQEMSLSALELSLGRDASDRVIWVNNIFAPQHSDSPDVIAEASAVFAVLATYVPDTSRIASTILLLRSMADFTLVNSVYSSYFPHPLPPSRVCVSPSAMPSGISILLSVSICGDADEHRKGLHVQSRSHWAPANIGPYSQAIHAHGWIEIAGMIPLVPGTMEPINTGATRADLVEQSVLAIQHVYRVLDAVGTRDGLAGGCCWVTSTAAAAPAVESWSQLCSGKQCMVVLAKALPRGVSVEWVGYATEHGQKDRHIEYAFADSTETEWVKGLVTAAKGSVMATVFTRRIEGFAEAWKRAGGGGVRVIPTLCVWDSNGRRWESGLVVRL